MGSMAYLIRFSSMAVLYQIDSNQKNLKHSPCALVDNLG